MSGRVYYPDIASYQAGINLAGWHAVMIKATENTGYLNPAYHAQMAEAARLGLKAGAYHFLRAGDAQAQAQYCFSMTGRGVPLMIDCEPSGTSDPSIGDAAAFTDAYRALGGTVYLIYLPHWYWQQLGSPILAALSSRRLQLVTSDYSGDPETDTGPGWASYGGMPRVTTWQYTSTGTVNGMTNVDINCFRGSGSPDVAVTLSELWSLWTTGALSGPAPGPAPAPPASWTETLMNDLPTLAQGATGEDVRTLQGTLTARHQAAAIDGAFGPATKTALQAFQTSRGLTADGIAGPLTWPKLLNR